MLVAPRSQLDQVSKSGEVRRTGVYPLVGLDPDDPSRALASIGEGGDALKQLLPHNKNGSLTTSHAPPCGIYLRRFSDWRSV